VLGPTEPLRSLRQSQWIQIKICAVSSRVTKELHSKLFSLIFKAKLLIYDWPLIKVKYICILHFEWIICKEIRLQTQFRSELIKPAFLIRKRSQLFLEDRGRDGLRKIESVLRRDAIDNLNTCVSSGNKIHYFAIHVLCFGVRASSNSINIERQNQGIYIYIYVYKESMYYKKEPG
jgi:hypothetical protein